MKKYGGSAYGTAVLTFFNAAGAKNGLDRNNGRCYSFNVIINEFSGN